MTLKSLSKLTSMKVSMKIQTENSTLIKLQGSVCLLSNNVEFFFCFFSPFVSPQMFYKQLLNLNISICIFAAGSEEMNELFYLTSIWISVKYIMLSWNYLLFKWDFFLSLISPHIHWQQSSQGINLYWPL